MKLFWQVFDALPLAARINQRILVVHGGLFEETLVNVDRINEIRRFVEPPGRGVFHDLLWSDPCSSNGKKFNYNRNGGLMFGPDVTKDFLEHNGLDLLIRSHEVRDRGYSIEHGGKLVTLFSAPNYCDCKLPPL